jgi:hypothetical protein
MNDTTWSALEKSFDRWPQSKASPVEPSDFDQAMQSYGQIDADYREFVLRYGGGIVGSNPIYGIRMAEFMGTVGGARTAPDVTNWFRNQRWPGTDNWLIFSIDGAGNPIGFAADGTVWISDHDSRQISQLASGIEDYLLKWCMRLRPVE